MIKVIRFILLVFVLSFLLVLPTKNKSIKNDKIFETEKTIPEIEARSALVFDLITEKIIFEKNSKESLPLASVTKIISSLVVADYIDLNKNVKISKNAILTPEPSTLRTGEHIKAGDLIALAMGESSNDAMTALVESMGDEKWFVELMRKKAQNLGGETMIFLNPTGLDIDNSASNYGSSLDLAKIVKNSLDSIIWELGNKKQIISNERIVHKIKHTNILRSEVSEIFGAKTGFTDIAGGNLILIIERPIGKPKLIIILGSSLEGRFKDAEKLMTLL